MQSYLKKLSVALSVLTLSVFCFPNQSKSETNRDPNKYYENKTIYSKNLPTKYEWFDYKRGLFVAEQDKKHVLLNFCAKDNKFCNKMFEQTYSDPEVRKMIVENFVAINVDGSSYMRIESNKAMVERDLLKKYEVDGFPTILFLNPEGKSVSGAVKGVVSPEKLVVILKYIATKAYKTTSLEAFERKAGK